MDGLNNAGDDWRQKEALLHAFGLLVGHVSPDASYVQNCMQILQEHAFAELTSANNHMRCRAIWIYGEFGGCQFNS